MSHTFNQILITPYKELIEASLGLSTHKGGPRWTDWDIQIEARHCRGDHTPVDDYPDFVTSNSEINRQAAWCGAICKHFGHQIVEFSMRLSETLSYDPDMLLMYGVKPSIGLDKMEQTPKFFREILQWFRVQESQVLIISEPTVAKELIVFPQAEMLHGGPPSQEHLNRMNQLVELNEGQLHKKGVIYVSRSKLPISGKIAGEAYLVRYLESLGVRIIYPEELSLKQQLSAYLSAEHLIFSEGSALHGLQLLGNNLGRVSVLLRRSGATMWKNPVSCRAQAYQEFDCVAGVLMTYNEHGAALDALGVTVLSESKIKLFIQEAGLTVKNWSTAEYIQSRDADLMCWLEKERGRLNSHALSRAKVSLELEKLDLDYLLSSVLLPVTRNVNKSCLSSYSKALDEYESGNFDTAIESIEAAIKLEPDIAYMHRILSTWLDRRGRIEEALIYANNAIQLTPEDPNVWAHLSNVLIKKNLVVDALAAIDKALQLAPNAAGFHRLRSQWLDRLGRGAEALMAAEVASSLALKDPSFFIHLSNMSVKYGTLEDALRYIDTAIKIDGKSATAYRLKSNVLEKIGDILAAKNAADCAVSLAPEDSVAIKNMQRINSLIN